MSRAEAGTTRLDKRVSQGFLLTRSEARTAIRRGAVAVDGKPCRDPSAHVAAAAAVMLDGKGEAFGRYLYIMLNKPAGYLSATEDSRDATVLELLPPQLRRVGLGVCGRLDKDSEGLLLLTNDGPLNHKLTSPRYHQDKLYRVLLDRPAGPEAQRAFEAGIDLGDFVTAPARLERLEEGRVCLVTLREGKFHQVKRMFAAQGLEVCHLERLALAGLTLDVTLGRGQWRLLTEAEITALKAGLAY